MPKIVIAQPLSYEFRMYEGPRLSLRQNGSHKNFIIKEEKRAVVTNEHFFPFKERNHNAQRLSKKQIKNIRAANLPQGIDWVYPNYQYLERVRIKKNLPQGIEWIYPDYQYLERVRLKKEQLNKSDTNEFNVINWERWEIHNKALPVPTFTLTQWDHIKASLYVVASKHLDKWIKLPEYKYPTEAEMAQTKNYAAETRVHQIDELVKKKEIFGPFLEYRNKKINEIKNERLKNTAFILDRYDIEEQSLETSTEELPGLIENAWKVFSNSKRVDCKDGKDHLFLLETIMCPHPLVGASKDKDRIYQLLREVGTQAFLWVNEGFEQDMQKNIQADGKIECFRTTSRLKFVRKIFKKIWRDMKPKIESGVLTCSYPGWKQAIKVEIENSTRYELDSMHWQNRAARRKLNSLQAPEQPSSDIFEPD